MQLKLEIKGLDKVRKQLERLGSDQLKQASASALNDAAFKARASMQDQMRRVFNNVSPYLVKSVQVEKATPDRLQAWIGPRKMDGGGTDPQKILRAQVYGGQRRNKRFEVALRSIGALPSGWLAVLPAPAYPGSVDARGDLNPRFAQQLIAHLAGTRRAAPRSRGRTPTPAGPVRYFVAKAGQRLKPGIWAAVGRDVKPVLLFVSSASYKPRLDMEAVAQPVQAEFEKRLRYRIRQAVGE